ncbi:MAG: TolC family protein, partial [Chitinophagaceae bacterium]
PLATVVIGGLITATILTLLVIPVLYIIFTKGRMQINAAIPKIVTLLCTVFLTQLVWAQNAMLPARISFDAAYDTALRNNLQLVSSDLQIQRSKTLRGTWLDVPKTGIFAENEDISPRETRGVLKIGVSQSIEWFGLYKAKKNLLQEQAKSMEISKQIKVIELKRDVQMAYYTLWYLQSKQILWLRLDSIYTALAKASALRVKTGESAGLDSIAASASAREINVQLSLFQWDVQTQQENLKKFMGTSTSYLPELNTVNRVEASFLDTVSGEHPQLQWQQQMISIARAETDVQIQSRKPNFEGRFFSQRLYGLSNPYSGFSVSMGVPLFGYNTNRNKVKAAKLGRDYQQSIFDYEKLLLGTNYKQAYQQLQKDLVLLKYYEQTGLIQADAMIKAANLAYRGGEISFAELAQYLTQATDIQKRHLDVLNQFNQTAIQLNYFLNK